MALAVADGLHDLFPVDAVGVLLTDHGGRFMEANDAALQLLGYSRDDLIAGTIVRPDLVPHARDAVSRPTTRAQDLPTPGPAERVLLRKNGTRFPAIVGVSWLEPGRALVLVIDQTARVRAEELLALKAEVLDNVPAMVAYWDRDLRNRMCNQAYAALYGFTPDAMRDRAIREVIDDDLWAVIEPHVRRALEGEPQQYERAVVDDSGFARHSHATYLPDIRHGEVHGIYVLITDITARKKAQRALENANEELDRRVAERTAALEAANAELRREIDERTRAEAALRQTEAQLRHSQKMEAVGRLAGGIAHDFNNVLFIILSYAEMVGDELGPTHPLHADVLEIRDAGGRAAELTRQLLAFSRQQVLEAEVIDLDAVIGGMRKLLRRLLGEDIDLRTRLEASRLVVADRGQLEQVVMNLAVNARDAMPTGGRLTIETATREIDEAATREYLDLKVGPHVELVVSDTGIGMDKCTQARIFEPFFTTKELGKGTGLGLATVFGIVKQSGGNVSVTSEPGRGTTFRVLLPVAQGEPLERAERVSNGPRLAHGTGTVLLVEDEPQVCHLAEHILRRAGYRVLSAATPADALALAANDADRIDLLLTDVVMPGMNGRILADELLAKRPDLKVVFMSGYTGNVVVHHGVAADDVTFLQKPFTPAVLVRKIGEVLGSTCSPGR
ncbi:MAG: PAS domain-containing protein [Deltaproteobacteria bacterium]|nr:PAS domain-containing protein [Deltaproteobacteria bacterium]